MKIKADVNDLKHTLFGMIATYKKTSDRVEQPQLKNIHDRPHSDLFLIDTLMVIIIQ